MYICKNLNITLRNHEIMVYSEPREVNVRPPRVKEMLESELVTKNKKIKRLQISQTSLENLYLDRRHCFK